MTRFFVLSSALLIAAACSSSDDTTASTTATSATTASTSTTGGGGTGGSTTTSAAGGMGGSTTTAGGQGGTQAAGGAGGGMIGVGGGNPNCNTCSEFMALCLSSGCPAKSTLCVTSTQPYGQLAACLCGVECYNDCEFTCSMNNVDSANCGTCMQAAVAGNCSAQYAVCQADN